MNLNNLSVLDNLKSRSISPENFTGAKSQGGRATTGTGADCARDLGPGWKISPSVKIQSGQIFEIALIDGPGTVEQIWMTPTGNWRFSILRFYWDDQEYPAVECPVGDFFACGWGKFAPVSSLAVCVNPGSAFNCYWPMPFARRCRITLENIGDEEMTLYYQINYSLSEISPQAGYFHAQFRRVSPLPYKTDYTILDGVQGKGRYVGTYMAWGVNISGWWGVKVRSNFFLMETRSFPPFAGRVPRTTSVDPIILKTRRRSSTRSFPPPMLVYPRSCVRMECIVLKLALVCTAGTSQIPFVLTKIYV